MQWRDGGRGGEHVAMLLQCASMKRLGRLALQVARRARHDTVSRSRAGECSEMRMDESTQSQLRSATSRSVGLEIACKCM